MSIHLKPAPNHESLLGAWHAQVAATAKQTPWLVRELLRRKHELLPKFTTYYQQLRALPRRTRRLLQRKVAPSLAGAALLFALGQGQAIAATINVGGGCSLVDAITAANADSATGGCTAGNGADTIVLPASSIHTLTSVNNSTHGSSGLPVISSEIVIEGNGSTITRDGGAPAFRLLTVSATGDLTLRDTTVSGGFAPTTFFPNVGEGGGLWNKGQLTLEDCTVTGNLADDLGGGVFSGSASTVTVTNSTVSDNSAGGSGGGVFSGSVSTAILTDSTITGNATGSNGSGGGVYSAAFTLTLTNSTVSDNAADAKGGGVYSRGDSLTLTNSTISNNAADGGGGMSIFTDTATLVNNTITGNSARYGNGGGIYSISDNLTVTNSTVSGNSSGDKGGGMFTVDSLTLTDSMVSGNFAHDLGGGVWTLSNSTTITNSTITGNSVLYHGGGVHSQGGTMILTNSTITGNSAGYYGGGVYSYGPMTLTRTLVSGNTASRGAEIVSAHGIVTANNFNLFGHDGLTSAQAFYNFSPGATDITATSNGNNPTALADILDTTLQDNGGPTFTHALVTGSPAIDASPVDVDCPATDQRGVTRPQGAACDIGAFEVADGGVLDTDGDGVPDTTDNCPTVANPGQADFDSDGLGDVCDPDDDNDGVADATDNCPAVANPGQANLDGDALGDACDPDDDGDGINDGVDNCPSAQNADQANLDGDALGDVCDPDDDGDGIADGSDNCPVVANANQANLDGDALGDACDPDDDGDGVADGTDNCPLVANPGQQDANGNGLGDACDGDDDGDGVLDGVDNCPSVSNANQADTNADGVGDACTHDLAVLDIVQPVTVTLTAKKPEQLKIVKVQMQNQSPHSETIPNAAALAALLQVTVAALDTPNHCPALPATLDADALSFPLTLKSKRKLSVPFAVTFGLVCIPDPLKSTKTALHADYRLSATVNHASLDGQADTDVLDDTCPHSVAAPFRLDPNPDGTIKDKGCGEKKLDKTLGADVLVDVVDKR